MSNLNLKCSICGKEFTDVDSYVEHVTKCAEEHKKKESEDLLKLNAELNKVKAAKEYYEDLLVNFKKNYPEVYELNFGKEKVCDCHKNENKCNDKCADSSKDSMKKACTSNKNTRTQGEDIQHILETDPWLRDLLRILGI